MKKSQYWTVKRTYAKQAPNDDDTYAIIDGGGKTIASFSNGDREKLTAITDAHNLCFIEQEEPK